MGRSLRNTPGGYVYHVLNRTNGRLPIFTKDADFEAWRWGSLWHRQNGTTALAGKLFESKKGS